MKNLVIIFVFLTSCAEAKFESPTQESQKEDVIYSFKKEFTCVDIPGSITKSVKFSERLGHFYIDNEVTPARKECSFVDIAVCGTMTEKN